MTEETVRSIVGPLIASIPPTLAAVAALIAARKVGPKITELHLQINSRMDQLLAASKSAAHAEGVVEGMEGERATVAAAKEEGTVAT